MSNLLNETLRETINELRDLISFLENELESVSVHGEYGLADQIYGELVDARKELNKLEKYEDYL